MYEVIPGYLRIGNAMDARNPRPLFEAEIKAILDVAYEEAPAQLPRDFIYCRFPLVDGAGNPPQLLQLAIETLVKLVESQTSTIVCCGGGMSRSPAIVAAALSIVRNQLAEEILPTTVAAHPHDLSGPFWADIVHACDAICTRSAKGREN